MHKLSGEDRSGSRTGPEVTTGKTTQRAPSVRPDFGCVSGDEEGWHECRKAMNMLETVQALQQTLSQAAKQSLDRRFGALFDKVYREDVLWQSWRQVRSNHGGPGIDGETIDYIEEELGVAAFLQDLCDQLNTAALDLLKLSDSLSR